MTHNRKLAAVLVATLSTASCAGIDQNGQLVEDQLGAGPVEVNSTTIGAALLLALLVAVSVSN